MVNGNETYLNNIYFYVNSCSLVYYLIILCRFFFIKRAFIIKKRRETNDLKYKLVSYKLIYLIYNCPK